MAESSLRRPSLFVTLAASYLFVACVLTVARSRSSVDAGLVEGSLSRGLDSHFFTWVVVMAVGAFCGWWQGYRGIATAIAFGACTTILAAIWEFDALMSPAPGPAHRDLAGWFLVGLFLAPTLGSTVVAIAIDRWKRSLSARTQLSKQ